MKELTVQEKAKAYDKAIERAKKEWIENLDNCYKNYREHLEIIFPELKESDDEKIRKEILDYIDKATGCERWVAWLEKQGKKELENYDEAEKEKVDFVGDGFIECHADFLDFKEGETYWLEYIGDDKYNVRSDNLLGKTYHITPCQLYTVFKKLTWLEKQGEQKPADNVEPTDYNSIDPHFGNPIDKVEPKFHKGDWAVSKLDGKARQISEVHYDEYNSYYVVEGRDVNLEEYDRLHHLWTIDDAKDGDVLISQYGRPFVYNGNRDSFNVGSYCGITTENRFEVATEECRWTENVNIHPATQEQRNTLMKAMADAGYTFDFKKKELRKLKFRVGDEIKSDNEEPLTITKIDENGYWSEDLFICGFDDAAKWELVGQKSAWSEEDEKMRKELMDFCIKCGKGHTIVNTQDDFRRWATWLKSLRKKLN